MAEMLRIESDGPVITATNFWSTDLARTGKFYLSLNAGAFRLLVPPQHTGALRDMRAAHTCVVSRGPYPELRLADALEVLFDDGTDAPFSLHLSPGGIDRMPLDTDTAETWVLSAWTHRVGTTATLALERPCHYRRSRRLPDLRPWQP